MLWKTRTLQLVTIGMMLFWLPSCTVSQVKDELQQYLLLDLDKLIWVEDTCFSIQEERIRDLRSSGKPEDLDKALRYLTEMQEVPVSVDFIRKIRDNPGELFGNARWCGNSLEKPTEESEVEEVLTGS